MKKYIFAILMMVAAAFAATSCGLEGGDDTNTSNDLTISVDYTVLRAVVKSSAKIIVKLGHEVVTD